MKLRLFTQKTGEFLDSAKSIVEENPDKYVRDILVAEDEAQRLHIFIHVRDDAKSQDLRPLIKAAQSLKKELIQKQGKTGFLTDKSLLRFLAEDTNPANFSMKQRIGGREAETQRRFSYQHVTDAINYQLCRYLYQSMDKQPKNIDSNTYWEKVFSPVYMQKLQSEPGEPLEGFRKLLQIGRAHV